MLLVKVPTGAKRAVHGRWHFQNVKIPMFRENGIENCVSKMVIWHWVTLVTLRPRQNVCHFADNIFKCISLIWIYCALIWISLKYIHKGPIISMSALVHWWWLGGEQATSRYLNQCWPSLPSHICVALPQWVSHGLLTLSCTIPVGIFCEVILFICEFICLIAKLPVN